MIGREYSGSFNGQFAVFKGREQSYVIGIGPFTELAEAPESQTAFYCNDFTLSDTKPWKVPSSLLEVDCLDEWLGSVSDLEFEWSSLDAEEFTAIFSEIDEMIKQGVIQKSVPVATEKALVKANSEEPVDAVSIARSLLQHMKPASDSFYRYGWSMGDRGFCGLSPELLFELDGLRLKTMALAGTAKSDEREVFAVDGKEIREHEFVAQTLVAKLADIGKVKREKRSIMDLGKLVHFHTAIEVQLDQRQSVNELIKRLHPTPALGPLPRNEDTLEMLGQWRKRLDCPEYFGAPFGLWRDGKFDVVVAIRGVHWQEGEIAVPSGCGVIEASRLVNEWRELRLKREAVKASFQL